MKVLIVGNGGREHALAWKIHNSPLVKDLYCAPGNPGMAEVADCVPIETTHIVELADFAQSIGADLTVVGPELPMVLGIADEFQRRSLTIFAPTRAAAEIEGSKAFARDFMTRHGIPSPRYAIAGSPEEALRTVDAGTLGFPVVLKADGLAAGKGAIIAQDAAQAREAVHALMEEKRLGRAGARLVLEEFLPGEEVSFLVISDGARVVPLISAQDHKRVFDDDRGPNTGGMGCVSPATNLSVEAHKQIMQDVILPTISGLAAEGRRFQGVLYAGLMLTAQGPRVLEFNARFGDPETQVILPRLRSDLVPVLLGAACGQLPETRLEWSKEAATCVVLASRGYPEAAETGKPIAGLDALGGQSDVMAFHGATVRREGVLTTVGGRVLGITALGATLEASIARAYAAVEQVSFEGMHYRRDIGDKAVARLKGRA
jgi:phosphoribosylamine---glycine ligase